MLIGSSSNKLIKLLTPSLFICYLVLWCFYSGGTALIPNIFNTATATNAVPAKPVKNITGIDE